MMKSQNPELIIASLDVIFFVINVVEVYSQIKPSMYRQHLHSLKVIDFVIHLTKARKNEDVYWAAVQFLHKLGLEIDCDEEMCLDEPSGINSNFNF